MKKINEVLHLHFCLDLSLCKSALVANISNGTASNYIKRFKELKIDYNIKIPHRSLLMKTPLQYLIENNPQCHMLWTSTL